MSAKFGMQRSRQPMVHMFRKQFVDHLQYTCLLSEELSLIRTREAQRTLIYDANPESFLYTMSETMISFCTFLSLSLGIQAIACYYRCLTFVKKKKKKNAKIAPNLLRTFLYFQNDVHFLSMTATCVVYVKILYN